MRTRQRGAALILFVTVLILGVAWYTVGALGKAPVATAERDAITGAALQKAKQALLGYLAAEAARTDHDKPGRLPCPESLASIGTANEGQAASNCSNVATTVGRLPWGTLGIDQLRDGYGEPLWLVISPGFRGVLPTTAINFATPAQLTYNDVAANAVAVIIAPGRPLNTLADPAALPAWCPAKVDQNSATRNTAPLAAANFIECGNATGSYRNPGSSQWSNDRALAITAAEWADAIAPGVADRLQRQVAPAMQAYYDTTSLGSWGLRFLPNASTFTAAPPTTSTLCGANDTFSGMPPSATVVAATCSTAWDSASVSGLGALLSLGGCAPWPNFVSPTEIHCEFTAILGGLATPRITVSAPRVGYSFRYIDTSMIMIEVNGPALALPLLPPYPTASTGNYSGSVNAANGRGSFSFDVNFPALSILESVRIRIPVPADALLADARSAWFVNNGWDRFTYYAVSQAASHDPTGAVCTPGGTLTNCLTANGLPASTPANDKRLVLVLIGPRALTGQTQPSTTEADYLEYQNGNVGTTTYETRTQGADFNDRLAVCPFKYQDQSGADVLVCS
jgi:hypothetical protein